MTVAIVLWVGIIKQEKERKGRLAANMNTAEHGEPNADIERLVVQAMGNTSQPATFKACYRLGYDFEKGRGVPQNYGEALSYYRKAAYNGYPPAEYRLGLLYEQGRGVPADMVKAMAWYILARERATGRIRAAASERLHRLKIKSTLSKNR